MEFAVGPARAKVSTLAFEPKIASQKTSSDVRPENRRPNITFTAELHPSQAPANLLVINRDFPLFAVNLSRL